MTEASFQTRVSKIDNNYVGNTEKRTNIPDFRIIDDQWGDTPTLGVPMKQGEQMTVTLTAPTVIQSISDVTPTETLFQPSVSAVASYVNAEQITQSSSTATAVANPGGLQTLAYVSKVAGGSTVTAEVSTPTEMSLVSDTRISVTIQAMDDCLVYFRNIGDWISNVTLSGLSTTRVWLSKAEIIIEEYRMLIDDTMYAFKLLIGAAASTYFTIMWLRYRAPLYLQYIMNIAGTLVTTNVQNVEDNHGAYLTTGSRVLSIDG